MKPYKANEKWNFTGVVSTLLGSFDLCALEKKKERNEYGLCRGFTFSLPGLSFLLF
jgi:hypothetical protein